MHLEVVVHYDRTSARFSDPKDLVQRPLGIGQVLEDESHEHEVECPFFVASVQNARLSNGHVQRLLGEHFASAHHQVGIEFKPVQFETGKLVGHVAQNEAGTTPQLDDPTGGAEPVGLVEPSLLLPEEVDLGREPRRLGVNAGAD